MTNTPQLNLGSNTNQLPHYNPFTSPNTSSSFMTNNQINPFQISAQKPTENPQKGNINTFVANNKKNSAISAIDPFAGLTSQNNPINFTGNSYINNNEQKASFFPFQSLSQKENQNIEKEEVNKNGLFVVTNTNISNNNSNPIVPTENPQFLSLTNKEKEATEVIEKKIDKLSQSNNNVKSNSDLISESKKNAFGFHTQMTFGENTSNVQPEDNVININLNIQEKLAVNNTEDKSNTNNNKQLTANNKIDTTNKEKEIPITNQFNENNIKANDDNNNTNSTNNIENKNEEKAKNKHPNSVIDLTLNNLPNAKIEDTLIKWKNDLEYQAEKYSMCSERLKNYELQFESEIESVSKPNSNNKYRYQFSQI